MTVAIVRRTRGAPDVSDEGAALPRRTGTCTNAPVGGSLAAAAGRWRLAHARAAAALQRPEEHLPFSALPLLSPAARAMACLRQACSCLLAPPGGSWRPAQGAEEAGVGPWPPLPLSLAGDPEPLGPPICIYLPVEQGGRGVGAMGCGHEGPRGQDARMGEWGEPMGKRVGQQGTLLLASPIRHQACQDNKIIMLLYPSQPH